MKTAIKLILKNLLSVSRFFLKTHSFSSSLNKIKKNELNTKFGRALYV